MIAPGTGAMIACAATAFGAQVIVPSPSDSVTDEAASAQARDAQLEARQQFLRRSTEPLTRVDCQSGRRCTVEAIRLAKGGDGECRDNVLPAISYRTAAGRSFHGAEMNVIAQSDAGEAPARFHVRAIFEFPDEAIAKACLPRALMTDGISYRLSFAPAINVSAVVASLGTSRIGGTIAGASRSRSLLGSVLLGSSGALRDIVVRSATPGKIVFRSRVIGQTDFEFSIAPAAVADVAVVHGGVTKRLTECRQQSNGRIMELLC